jgi:hypothetical protein
MAPWGGMFTEEELGRTIAYIRTFCSDRLRKRFRGDERQSADEELFARHDRSYSAPPRKTPHSRAHGGREPIGTNIDCAMSYGRTARLRT